MIACDLGSNTLRMVEFNPFTCKPVRTFEKIVRTAKGLHDTKRIGVEAEENILKALKEASALFDFTQPSVCVTTQAMRIATNAHEIIEHIYSTFGLKFQIISGEEEAYYTAVAIEHALKREGLCADTYALFDLGGGSTEITLCSHGIKQSQSFPFGIVTTAERFKEDVNEGITQALNMLDAFVQQYMPFIQYQQLIATAGTPTTVSAFLQGLDYEHYDATKVNGTSLHVSDFKKAYTQLTTMTLQEAERYTGTHRKDLVEVGILLCLAIMQKLGFERCIVMDDGLREGVAISNCNKSVSS
jgi:exopolyphosphatase/guanosine-5'-triphosphate,3'-diphosphate pyrophosphatase